MGLQGGGVREPVGPGNALDGAIGIDQGRGDRAGGVVAGIHAEPVVDDRLVLAIVVIGSDRRGPAHALVVPGGVVERELQFDRGRESTLDDDLEDPGILRADHADWIRPVIGRGDLLGDGLTLGLHSPYRAIVRMFLAKDPLRGDQVDVAVQC